MFFSGQNGPFKFLTFKQHSSENIGDFSNLKADEFARLIIFNGKAKLYRRDHVPFILT